METPFIYCNDNLKVMQAMPSESVDLIYLDPPFNTGQEFAAPLDSPAEGASFSDVWSWDADRAADLKVLNETHGWLANFIQLAPKELHSGGMMAYLAFMSPRLVEIHRLLKPTGSVFLHCDQTASHYLKIAMDHIWGMRNFRNDIAWCYQGQNSARNRFPAKHDSLLYYSKDRTQTKFEPQYLPLDPDYVRTAYSRRDGDGRHYRERTDHGKTRRYYLDESPGRLVSSWWDDITIAYGKERTGYRTQKPLKLLERIIMATTEPGDLVLDPFCGCATTCVAAHHLGRRWIGVDKSEKAYELVKLRLAQSASQGVLGAPLETIGFAKLY